MKKTLAIVVMSQQDRLILCSSSHTGRGQKKRHKRKKSPASLPGFPAKQLRDVLRSKLWLLFGSLTHFGWKLHLKHLLVHLSTHDSSGWSQDFGKKGAPGVASHCDEVNNLTYGTTMGPQQYGTISSEQIRLLHAGRWCKAGVVDLFLAGSLL